ncbi:hypothetical protein CO683_00865 [Bradyrhizobium ottawaense]|uniref:glycosyl hydrolase family 28-related protein n=1 Tax=Bradyrhizobium ottawaense TaxID=931866 RepID=UPI000BE9DA40|nr:glycosyl hydrolase family 28-related protein [Bradyrhizobium ottawaense]PDT71743.1 hypothetical protein CO683_00865 [Bradyrhizobium ottawaense]
MTISSQTSRISYVGDGSTTAFPVPFYFAANADLVVYLQDTNGNQTPQVLGTNYNLSGATLPSGGTCTFTTAPTSGYLATIYRDPAVTQTTSYSNNDAFPAKSHELALDKLTTIAQRTRDQITRSIRQSEGEGSSLSMLLAPVATRKNKLFGFGANGELIYPAGPTFTAGTYVGVADIDSRATAQVTTFGGSINLVRTGGYAAPGDGGGGTYKRGTGGGSFTDGGGVSWVPIAVDDSINVKVFGAKGDGSTDDTAAIQAAITAYQGTGATIFLPRGAYKVSSPITITGTLRLVGESRSGAAITWTSTTLYVLNINTAQQVFIERITFNGPASATAGNVITLDGPAPVGNQFSYIRDCGFAQGYTHIATLSACDWTIENCTFSGYVAYGTYVSDTLNNDAGDSYIGGCTYSAYAANAVAIEQVSSGGLKIANNKILGGSYGYRLDLTSTGPSTVDLLMNGNSIENQITAAIVLSRPAGSVQFGSVVIDGNQIGGAGSAVSSSWVGISTDTNAGWLSRLIISDNLILLPVGTGSPDFYGISLGSPSSFIVSGNDIIACPNAGGQNFGITIGAGATAGLIGVNKFDVYGGATWTNKISNVAPASVLVQQSVPQSGNAGVTCSTAYGSLYIGTVAVTFPTPFDIPPTVKCYPNSLVSGVSAWPTAISKTGFTLNAVSATNGGAGTVTWEALGVL